MKTVRMITTLFEKSKRTEKKESIEFKTDKENRELHIVNLYPHITYQTFEGFGGAITEAAGHTLQSMSEEHADSVMRSYFGEAGLNYHLIRTHIDSCDFSLKNYSANEDPLDKDFLNFDLSHDRRYIFPWIKKAQDLSSEDVSIMLTPWSPPAYMKTNACRNHGGELKPEWYTRWAEYICKYISVYLENGIKVTKLSIQNEPNATQTWDSCVFSGNQEKAFLENALYPALLRHNLEGIQIYIWDHNKENVFDRVEEIVDENTNEMIHGVAFHWYSGDHFDALRLIKERYPDKHLLFSEGCIEFSGREARSQLLDAQRYAHDIIGNLNSGMDAFIDWNIILNEEGGPNHVNNYCDAPIIYNRDTRKLQYNLSYYYIEHFSKYIQSGACRIATTKYSENIEVVAFKNPDETMAVVILNRTGESYPVWLRLDGELAPITIPGQSISTILI